MEEQKKEENVNKKGKNIIIVILCLLVLGLGGFIVYDKFISSDNNTETKVKKDDTKDTKEEEKEEKIDLSNVPEVDSECTIEYSINDYNNRKLNNSNNSNRNDMTCAGQSKVIINDVVVDGKKIDVQAIRGTDDKQLAKDYPNIKLATEEETGLFINGVKYASLYTPILINHELKEIFVKDNMLFAHLDGGTGVVGATEIMAFDKNGKQVYNLSDHLSGIKYGIMRPSVKISDNSITFQVGEDGSPDTWCKYIVKFSNGKFEEPVVVNE